VRISWAIPCRYVEVNDGLVTIIGGGSNVITLLALPGVVGTMVAIQLVTDEDDDERHMFGNQVLGPDMAPVTELAQVEFDMGEVNPLKPAGWEQALIPPIAVQFPVAEEGQYTLQLSVDDRSTTVPLLVQTPHEPA
jgi:hypothetical protein